MIETPADLIETPPDHAEDRADLLADVLAHIRLSGSIFMRGTYGAPWALETPESQELIDLLAPGWERLIPFHAVRRGVAWVDGQGLHHELQHGDLAILPHAHQHLLGAGPSSTPSTRIIDLVPPLPWTAMPLVELDGGGSRTEIVCGYFRCDELLFNSVLRHLPPIFVIRPEGAVADFFTAMMNYVMAESPFPGKEAPLAARLPELLLAEALRIYSRTAPSGSGWLAATRDPVVGRALAILHGDPAYGWSVDELARRANTSRSVLGERFRALLDQSPMQYLVEWRMQLAAGLLRSTTAKIADIAEQVGYGSDAAFSRAFHRHVGQWPAEWRQAATS